MIDYLQIQVSNCEFELKEINSEEILNKFNSAIENVIGLKLQKTFITSSEFNILDFFVQNPSYGHRKYLSKVDANRLRNDLIIQLATIESLKKYQDVIICSSRDSDNSSKRYIYEERNDEGLEISVVECKFLNKSYLELNELAFLQEKLEQVLSSIFDFEFGSVLISSILCNNEKLLIEIHDATYHGIKYQTFLNANSLRNSIINVLQSVQELDISDVEIKTAKKIYMRIKCANCFF